jgi:hypothetical protein
LAIVFSVIEVFRGSSRRSIPVRLVLSRLAISALLIFCWVIAFSSSWASLNLIADARQPINVLFFTFFKAASGEFLGRAWLKDPEELQERTQARKQAPWSGFYFVNVGEGPHRNWDDCKKYGFLSAGQGERYGNAIKKLKPDDLVFGYMKGHGYVGFGTVTRPAVMVRDFTPDGSDKKLLDLPLKQPNLSENKDDPTRSEWVVGVKWEKTFDRDEAKRFQGAFANQNIVCLLRDGATVDFLRKEFGIAS